MRKQNKFRSIVAILLMCCMVIGGTRVPEVFAVMNGGEITVTEESESEITVESDNTCSGSIDVVTEDAANVGSGEITVTEEMPGVDSVPVGLDGITISEDLPMAVTSDTPMLLANSVSVSKTGLASITGFDYVLNYRKFSLVNAQITTTNSNFKTSGNYYVYTGTVRAGAVRSISGMVTLRWSNAVESTDGQTYDVVLSLTNFKVRAKDDIGGFTVLQSTGEGLWIEAYPINYWNHLDSYVTTSMSCDITYKIVKTGTNTAGTGNVLLAWQDLDIAGVDNDYTERVYGNTQDTFTESIGLVSGYGSRAYTESNTVLNIRNNNTVFLATQGTGGADQILSGFSILGAASGTTVHWAGTRCGTLITTDISDSMTKYKITPSSVGPGTISPSSIVEAYKGQNKSFTMTANTGAHIQSLKVDGVAQTITNPQSMTYRFSNVSANHTIDVVFAYNTYKIHYDANGSQNPNHQDGERTQNTVTGTMADSTYTYNTKGSLRTNAFVRTGYEFIGWNTKQDGTGTAYPNSPFDLSSMYSNGYGNVYNMTTSDGATLTLYAQWRKKLGTTKLTIVSEETGNAMSGVSFKLYKRVNNAWVEMTDVGTKTTDSNGQITVSDLHWFDYEWRCVGVPVGYQMIENSIATSITASQLSTQAQRICYMKHVDIVLDSTVLDIINKENPPAFLYHIAGTDAAGEYHEYNVMVQTNQNKSGTETLHDIFAGTYKITQIPVQRYIPGNAQNVSNATVSGSEATVDVLRNVRAEVRFPYTIKQYGGFSHTDAVKNHLYSVVESSPPR